MSYPIIKVIWIDACSYGDTIINTSEVSTCVPLQVEIVGFLIHETEEYIVLAVDIIGDDSFRNLHCIPTCCIRARELIA